MAAERSNVSADLVWQITRNQNAFLVQRNNAGGVRFSRDPLNPVNIHSRKYAGYANDKALGLQSSENGGVVLIAKNASNTQNPAKNIRTLTYGPNTSSRKYVPLVLSELEDIQFSFSYICLPGFT
ncbi:60S ribosomal protein L28 [Talaromyces stipitatus ATCC 10500]|uniref:60S ribosomal protein L28 n=1 Tax=Talaromyces stipitatus (strain ATCC 10500 / CBS 375.48 / QM 6759 / NRRL 1006) TaxID=441959 RepID=B8MTP7_TALSN|nr:60S ribosomal protein L28 [Talaromyces stipitatus ATCC 10500]EED12532.1 60S ribosomal protein L28 [Talaromyces stipitatus ATCC 10500]